MMAGNNTGSSVENELGHGLYRLLMQSSWFFLLVASLLLFGLTLFARKKMVGAFAFSIDGEVGYGLGYCPGYGGSS